MEQRKDEEIAKDLREVTEKMNKILLESAQVGLEAEVDIESHGYRASIQQHIIRTTLKRRIG